MLSGCTQLSSLVLPDDTPNYYFHARMNYYRVSYFNDKAICIDDLCFFLNEPRQIRSISKKKEEKRHCRHFYLT